MISEFDKLDEQLLLNERPKKRLFFILLGFCVVFCFFVAGIVYAYHIRFGEHNPLNHRSVPWLKPVGSVKEKPLISKKIPDNMEVYNRLTSNDNAEKKIEQILPLDAKYSSNINKSKKILHTKSHDVANNVKNKNTESSVKFENKKPILISTDLSNSKISNKKIVNFNKNVKKTYNKNHDTWQVQMGVTHDKKQAIILFKKWKKKYPLLFKNKKLIFESVSKPYGIIYRMRIVSFSNYNATKQFCIKASNVHLPCFLPKD